MARRAQVKNRIEHRGTMVDVTWKDIRSLRLRVLPPDGRLAVSAPHHVPLETVRQFLDANREWTARHSQRVRMNAPVVLPLVDGGRVKVFNDRGSFAVRARVTDRARPGCVVALSIWWKKLSPDGANANAVTSQALTDFGRAATFYDCLVEVTRAPR